MKRLSVTLLILLSFVLQGFAASACHHADTSDSGKESCHQDMDHSATHSHETESTTQMIESHQDPNCMMCSTGRCFSEAPLLFQAIADAKTEKLPQSKFINLTKHWASLTLRPNFLASFKPPIPSFLLPQLQNWQAFFSVFLN